MLLVIMYGVGEYSMEKTSLVWGLWAYICRMYSRKTDEKHSWAQCENECLDIELKRYVDTDVVHQLCVILSKFSRYQILEFTNTAELLCPGGWRCRCWKQRSCCGAGVEGDEDAGSREAAGGAGLRRLVWWRRWRWGVRGEDTGGDKEDKGDVPYIQSVF